MSFAIGQRVDIYEDEGYADSGVVLNIDRPKNLALVVTDADDDVHPFWVYLDDLRKEGDDDPGYDPAP